MTLQGLVSDQIFLNSCLISEHNREPLKKSENPLSVCEDC